MIDIACTTNNLEAYSSALKNTVNINHLNIWKLVDIIKCEERFSSTELQKFMQEELSQNKKYRDMNLHRKKNVMEKYDPSSNRIFSKSNCTVLNFKKK